MNIPNPSMSGHQRFRLCTYIALVLLLLSMGLPRDSNSQASSHLIFNTHQSFSTELGNAYAHFDEASQTWVIGNSTIEERLQFTPNGSLQQTSLLDRSTGQLRNLSQNTFNLTLGGGGRQADLSAGLTLVATSSDPTGDGALQVRIQMDHPDSGQIVTLDQSIRPGFPLIENRVVLVNRSGQEVRVVRADSVALGVTASPSKPWEATTIANSGVVNTRVITAGESLTAESGRASGALEEFIPLIVARDTSNGRGILAGLRWSSNWTLSASLDGSGNPVIRGGLRLDDSADGSLILSNGEAVESPWGFIGLFSGGLDDATLAINRYTAAASPVRPGWAALPPVTWNSWFAYQRDLDEKRLDAEVDLAAQAGVEVFYIDYGWSRAVGDWQPDPTRFPNGLDPIINRVHNKGMKFGLWVAFGQIMPDKMPAQQPGQYLAVQPQQAAIGIDGSEILCLTAAEDWLVNDLNRIVTDYQLDWLKFDQPMLAACYAPDHGHDPNAAGSLYSNTLAFYRILERLQRAHPNLVIENCFNGNGYLDYGTRQHTTVAWLTDDSGLNGTPMPKVQQVFYGTSYAFRPDYLTQWLALLPGAPAAPGRGTSLRDLSYQAYSSMAGAFGLSMRLSEMDGLQLARVKSLIGEYKAVRPLITGGDLYHLIGPSNGLDNQYGGGWFSLEYYDPQKRVGAVLYVRNGENSPDAISPPLRGLDPRASYRVWQLGDGTMATIHKGSDLLSAGLTLSAEPRQGNWIVLEQMR